MQEDRKDTISRPNFWKRVALQSLALLAIAALFGTAANLFLPQRIAWVEDWSEYIEARAYDEGLTLADVVVARRLVESGEAIVFDARPQIDYEAGHLPGAMALPFIEVETRFPDYAPIITPSDTILTYCASVECDEALLLGIYLRDQGFTNIVLFAGGWEEWEKYGP
jgi:rhodanese-related sulfurtransferase